MINALLAAGANLDKKGKLNKSPYELALESVDYSVREHVEKVKSVELYLTS